MAFIGFKKLQLVVIVTSMSLSSFTQISLFIYFLVYPSHKIFLNVSKIFIAKEFESINFLFCRELKPSMLFLITLKTVVLAEKL